MVDFAGLLFVRGQELIIAHDIASGVVVSIGDLVKTSGGTVLDMATNSDNLAFFGVAKEAHYATDPAGKISVAIPNANAVYLATLDAATSANQGDLFQCLSGTANKLHKSTTNPIAMSVQKVASALTCEVILLIPNVTNGPRAVGDAS